MPAKYQKIQNSKIVDIFSDYYIFVSIVQQLILLDRNPKNLLLGLALCSKDLNNYVNEYVNNNLFFLIWKKSCEFIQKYNQRVIIIDSNYNLNWNYKFPINEERSKFYFVKPANSKINDSKFRVIINRKNERELLYNNEYLKDRKIKWYTNKYANYRANHVEFKKINFNKKKLEQYYINDNVLLKTKDLYNHKFYPNSKWIISEEYCNSRYEEFRKPLLIGSKKCVHIENKKVYFNRDVVKNFDFIFEFESKLDNNSIIKSILPVIHIANRDLYSRIIKSSLIDKSGKVEYIGVKEDEEEIKINTNTEHDKYIQFLKLHPIKNGYFRLYVKCLNCCEIQLLPKKKYNLFCIKYFPRCILCGSILIE